MSACRLSDYMGADAESDVDKMFQCLVNHGSLSPDTSTSTLTMMVIRRRLYNWNFVYAEMYAVVCARKTNRLLMMSQALVQLPLAQSAVWLVVLEYLR
jgi:hypothetical protein